MRTFSIRQREAVQIERENFVFSDRHILGRVRQQSDGLASLSRSNCFGKRSIRLNGAAGCLENLCSHAGLCGERAVGVLFDANAGSCEARGHAVNLLLRRDVRVEADERAAVDCNGCRTACKLIVDAINNVSVAICGFLNLFKRTVLDCQRARLNLNSGNIANKCTVLNRKRARRNRDRIAVILLCRNCAVAGNGNNGVVFNTKETIGRITPDVFRVVNLVTSQIERQTLGDRELGVLNDIRKKRDRVVRVSDSRNSCFKCRILGLADLCNVLDRRNRLGLQRDRVLRLPLERVGNRNLVATQVFDSRANRQRSLVLI